MEKMSRKCKIICAGAVACLACGIVLAPAGPTVPQFPAGREMKHDTRGAGNGADGAYQPVQNCTGGESVNCHRPGNQAGL